jgi:hypothetical protein
MPGADLTAVIMMICMIMLAICFWRQILMLMLFIIVTIFCFGIYYIVRTLGYWI